MQTKLTGINLAANSPASSSRAKVSPFSSFLTALAASLLLASCASDGISTGPGRPNSDTANNVPSATRWASVVLEVVNPPTDAAISEFARAALAAFKDREAAFVAKVDMRASMLDVIRKYGKPDSQTVLAEDPAFEAHTYGRIRLYTKVGNNRIEGLEAPTGWLADGIRAAATKALAETKTAR